MENQFNRERRRMPGVPVQEHYAIGGGWVGGSGNQGGGTVGGHVGRDGDPTGYGMFEDDYPETDNHDYRGGRPQVRYRSNEGYDRAPDYGPRATYDWGTSYGPSGPRSRDRGHYSDEGGSMGRQQHYRAYGASEGQRVGGRGEEYGRSGREGGHFDHDYLTWRQGEIDRLDAEYAEFVKERQTRFRNEFDTWRKSRQAGPTADDTTQLPSDTAERKD